MRRVFESVLDAIGDTPLVRLSRLGAGLKPRIYGKLEFMNPAGSIKDRIAKRIIEHAEKTGELKPGGTIIEATSGNTGMGLAMMAAVKGYKCIFVMPDKMSDEKIKALRAFGAQVVITPTAVEPEDPRSYYSVADKLVKETPKSFYANQYHNPQNPETHYLSTGPEIWEQTDGQIDVLVAGLGTGGTISGISRFLKEKNPDIKIVGVDPVGSLYYDYFQTGALTDAYSYKVEGIGEDFLPSTMSFEHVDEVVRVNDRESFLTARDVVRIEGIYAGGSTGSAVAGAIQYAKNHNEDMMMVVIMPDGASRYLSKLYDDGWMRENRFLNQELRLGAVRDLLEHLSQASVITAVSGEPVGEVIKRMKKHGFSQLPILGENGNIIGLVHESKVLEAVLEESNAVEHPIDALMESNYCTVNPETSIAVLSDLFGKARVALVMKEGKISHVISRIDLIDYMAHISHG